jgi:hypothetical protein
MGFGVARRKGQSMSNQVDGDVVAACLPGEHAKKMQGIDVGGINRANLSIKALGLLKSTGLVVRQRRRKLLGNARTGVLWRRRAIRVGAALARCDWRLVSVHGERSNLSQGDDGILARREGWSNKPTF